MCFMLLKVGLFCELSCDENTIYKYITFGFEEILKMDSIGAEVGQKMRSAIKAKLLELNCYVDDELPDYIMVMVANKRTKSQMNEDLSLFLSNKTSTFVEWLHIVLKKLKEVTVTNPEVYKKVAKRKSTDYPDFNVKKERKQLNIMFKCEKDESRESSYEHNSHGLNKLADHRKVTVLESQPKDNYDDNFDIPLLSDVNFSSQEDLDNIERKIKSVKSRLGLLVESDTEDTISTAKDITEDNSDNLLDKNKQTINFHNIPTLNISRMNIRQDSETDTSESRSHSDEKRKHTPITFDIESPKKLSILDRLGKRTASDHKIIRLDRSESRTGGDSSSKYSKDDPEERKERSRSRKKNYKNISSSRKDRRSRESRLDDKKSSSDSRKERNKGVLSRLGVMSKISVPPKELEEPEPEDELKTREVRSVVQVKPRIIPTDVPQPNKSLLLKAVAEAHRSIAQTPNVGSRKRDSSVTQLEGKTETKHEERVSRKLPQIEKNKLRNIILAQIAPTTHQPVGDDIKADVYISKLPIRNDNEAPEYIPASAKSSKELSNEDANNDQHFIVTLEGVERSLVHNFTGTENAAKAEEPTSKVSAKLRLDSRRLPSPVTTDRLIKKVINRSNVPDKLPIVRIPQSMKNKERCKYWPNCRQGDKCEFVHPISNCEMFPHCQFKDQCIYLHPPCKFGPSCTKRDCPYSHLVTNTAGAAKGYLPVKTNSMVLQNCKYFPQCTNPSCPYLHPKPCKYGKYCKNPMGCMYSHKFLKSKSSLSWRSK